jgi:tetratricopeptide (TPR) repeat protein
MKLMILFLLIGTSAFTMQGMELRPATYPQSGAESEKDSLLIPVTNDSLGHDQIILSQMAQTELTLGNTAILNGNFLEGLKYSKWVTNNTNNQAAQASAFALLGELYFLGRGGIQPSKELAKKYCTLAVEQTDYLPAKALALVTLGQLEENPKAAKRCWKQALEGSQPDQIGIKAGAYYLLGSHYVQKDKLDKAKASYSQTLAIAQPPFTDWAKAADEKLRKLYGLEYYPQVEQMRQIPPMVFVIK